MRLGKRVYNDLIYVEVWTGIQFPFFPVVSRTCFGFLLVFGNSRGFSLLLSSVYISQGLCCSSCHPTGEQPGGAPEAGRRHSWDS